MTEHYVSLFLSPSSLDKRPLEAAKLLLSLARKAQRGEFISTEGKSSHQLFVERLEVVENYAEEAGIETMANQKVRGKAADEVTADAGNLEQTSTASASGHGPLIRFLNPPLPYQRMANRYPPTTKTKLSKTRCRKDR